MVVVPSDTDNRGGIGDGTDGCRGDDGVRIALVMWCVPTMATMVHAIAGSPPALQRRLGTATPLPNTTALINTIAIAGFVFLTFFLSLPLALFLSLPYVRVDNSEENTGRTKECDSPLFSTHNPQPDRVIPCPRRTGPFLFHHLTFQSCHRACKLFGLNPSILHSCVKDPNPAVSHHWRHLHGTPGPQLDVKRRLTP